LVEHTTENRGVPGSSPGLAISKHEIPHGCEMLSTAGHRPGAPPSPVGKEWCLRFEVRPESRVATGFLGLELGTPHPTVS